MTYLRVVTIPVSIDVEGKLFVFFKSDVNTQFLPAVIAILC
jgi:hypothetical protein